MWDCEEALLNEERREGTVALGKEKKEIQLERENAYRNAALRGRYFAATGEVKGKRFWEWSKKEWFYEENKEKNYGCTKIGTENKYHQESD